MGYIFILTRYIMENERDFKGIWIPKEIYLSKLPWMAKILYCEIDSFTKNGKECFISNKYLDDNNMNC